jgi:outer membrane protein assembly factor BamB
MPDRAQLRSGLSKCLLPAAVLALAGLAALLIGLQPGRSANPADSEPTTGAKQAAWPMLGCTPQRNMINILDKNIPADWTVEKRDQAGKIVQKGANIKWVAALGSRAYGGPVISGGKIFVGTNNHAPRNPNITGDKGVIMCFRESDGQFLWQIIHDKLPSGQVNDWPTEGIASHPVIDAISPPPLPDPKKVAEAGRWIKDLDSDHFVIRQKANDELEKLGGAASPALRERLKNKPTLDVRTRVENLLHRLDPLDQLDPGDWPRTVIYYVSNRCEIVCASTTDGKIIWQLDMMKGLSVFPHNLAACSPLIAGDTLFVVTGNGVDEGHVDIPSPEAPSFVAVDKNTGKLKWKDSSPGKNIMHSQWSNPAYGVINGKPQVVFPGGDGWLYSFEPETGKLIWKFDANPKDAKYELGGRGTKSDFIATPVIVDNKVIIGTGQDPEHYEGLGHLWCIDMTKAGDVSPELVIDAKAKPPKTKKNPNSAVVWHYGGPTTEEDAEKFQRDYYFGRTLSTVAVHGGLVYAAELAGYLHCLDAKTGKPHWVYDLKAAVWGHPSWIDGKVYIATEEGDVWIFRHGAICDVVRKVEIGESIRTTTPIAVNGVLYVMTESHLYAIAGK